MKLLANPMFIRMAALLISAVAAFIVGIVGTRMLRRGIIQDGEISGGPSDAALPLQACTVIQQLKQEKFALQNEQQLERRRTKNSEHVTAAIIANLPCGMLMVTPNYLICKANAAARQILGYASPLGMSVRELFRDTRILSPSSTGVTVGEAFESALRGTAELNHFECEYFTPNTQERRLQFNLIPVTGASGDVLGVACVISDQSAMAELRHAQTLRAQTSAEMALELRTSLSTIRQWVEHVGGTADAERVRDLAGDVSAETKRLEKVVGGFLAGNPKAGAAQA